MLSRILRSRLGIAVLICLSLTLTFVALVRAVLPLIEVTKGPTVRLDILANEIKEIHSIYTAEILGLPSPGPRHWDGGPVSLDKRLAEIEREIRELATQQQYRTEGANGARLANAPTPITTTITALVGALGTMAALIFSWRSDRRATKEAELKVVQMEQQILELERKLKDSGSPKRIDTPDGLI